MYRENMVYVEFVYPHQEGAWQATIQRKSQKGPDMTEHTAHSVTGIQLGILEHIPQEKRGQL